MVHELDIKNKEMNIRLEILFNPSYYEILNDIFSKIKIIYTSRFILSKNYKSDNVYVSVTCDNLNLKEICKLGSAIFYALYISNDYCGFSGWLKSEGITNNTNQTIIFLNKYKERILSEIKELNQPNQPLSFDFEVDINYDDLSFSVIEGYNSKYGTNFRLNSIYNDDGLDYAKINVIKTDIIDVFCLGIMICYDDIIKNEITRNKNY